jgi:hypothetical protein
MRFYLIKESPMLFRRLPIIAVLLGSIVLLDGLPAWSQSDLQALQTTFAQRRRERKEGVSRGGVCGVAPGQIDKVFTLWSDRPLFLWQSDRQVSLSSVQIFQASTDERVWKQTLSPADQSALYTGKPLQPGQIYSWQLTFLQAGRPRTQEYRFRILPAAQRDSIALELQRLTQPLQKSKATAEAIALRQSRYLVDRGLLSDALQVLSAVPQPSAATQEMLQGVIRSACGGGGG